MAKDTNQNISQLLNNMKRAKTVALFCHISPDPDTFCSAFAMKAALEKQGKQVDVFCDDDMPSCLEFMLDSSSVLKNSDNAYDFALSVDCSDITRLGNSAKIFLRAKDNGAVDHHKGHINFAKVTVLDCFSASCSEIVMNIILSQNLIIFCILLKITQYNLYILLYNVNKFLTNNLLINKSFDYIIVI